jgi:hypothetical protein
MSKQRRTVLSGVVTPFAPDPADEEPRPLEAGPEPSQARRKPATIQQTVYLPPVVHEQLRELAFAERVKMHALLMEGLDLVFRARGLKPLSELTRAP